MIQKNRKPVFGAENGKHYQGLREVRTRLTAALSKCRSREAVLKTICELMVKRAGYILSWIGWLNPRTGVVVPAAWSGAPAEKYIRSIRVTADEGEKSLGPTGIAIRQGSEYICNDFFGDSGTRPWRDAAKLAGVQASAAFPVLTGDGRVCGTLNLYSDEVDAFRPLDVEVLREIAEDISFRLARLDEEASNRIQPRQEPVQKEELFRKFAESANEVFWITRTRPELILYVNPAFEKIWGMPVGELYKRPRIWTDAIHLDDRPRVIEVYSNWIQRIPGSAYDVRYRIVRPDGQIRWIHDRGFAMIEEAEDGSTVAGIAEEITEQKLAEEDLRASRERYRSVLESMIEGCMIIGYDWRYLFVNDAAARHGYQEKSNLIGRTMQSVYPGVEKSAVYSHYRKCMEDRVPQTFESSYTFEDGTTNWYEFRVTPVPEGIFVLSLDICGRKPGGSRSLTKRGG